MSSLLEWATGNQRTIEFTSGDFEEIWKRVYTGVVTRGKHTTAGPLFDARLRELAIR
jgi:hypothetical protein